LVRLGWSHGDQEEFTIEEMVKYFDFDHVQKSSAVMDVEKLNWLNGVHIRKATPERLLGIVVEDFAALFGDAASARVKTTLAVKLAALIQPKVKLLKEMADQLVPLCTPGAVEVDGSGLKWEKDPVLKTATKAAIRQACEELSKKIVAVGHKERSGADQVWGHIPSLSDIGVDHTAVDAFLRVIGEQHSVKLGDLAQPMRLLVTGRMVSASLFDVMAVLPWDVVQSRLEKAQSL
jgi:glutamyl-tRNA synthetase